MEDCVWLRLFAAQDEDIAEVWVEVQEGSQQSPRFTEPIG